MLYLSMLLRRHGCISANKIWITYLNDPKSNKKMFESKTFMRSKVLDLMEIQGKVVRSKADDLP